MRKCIEPANQLKSSAGLACCPDDLEKTALCIFMTPLPSRLPSRVQQGLQLELSFVTLPSARVAITQGTNAAAVANVL